jgi:hypothetical protein
VDRLVLAAWTDRDRQVLARLVEQRPAGYSTATRRERPAKLVQPVDLARISGRLAHAKQA